MQQFDSCPRSPHFGAQPSDKSSRRHMGTCLPCRHLPKRYAQRNLAGTTEASSQHRTSSPRSAVCCAFRSLAEYPAKPGCKASVGRLRGAVSARRCIPVDFPSQAWCVCLDNRFDEPRTYPCAPGSVVPQPPLRRPLPVSDSGSKTCQRPSHEPSTAVTLAGAPV
jgi:hypothetical protein